MSSIKKLQYISLCAKVTQELENHVGIRDKDLAEFVISLANDSKSEKEFLKKLEENDAEFTFSFSKTLFNLIKKMMPKEAEEPAGGSILKDHLSQNSNKMVEEVKRNPQEIGSKFPALAIPDNTKNQEELELDLGFDEAPPVAPAKVVPKLVEEPERRRMKSESCSRSRSKSEERRKKHKKKKRRSSSSRSRSRSSRASSRSRSASSTRRDRDRKKKDRHDRERKEKRDRKEKRREEEKEATVGEIYEGVVTNITDYGCFVSLSNFRRKTEGLVHVSNMSRQRVNNAKEFVKKGQKVWVKVTSINAGKVALSMKEADQETGEDIGRGDSGRQGGNKSRSSRGEREAIEAKKERLSYGSITGIKPDEAKEVKNTKRIASPDMWERSRMQYFGKKEYMPREMVELEEVNVAEEVEELEVEIKEDEPTFLRGQTTRAGVNLSPVRVVKNPEGSLQREIMNAMQYAKERRDIREQQRSAGENVPKEFKKIFDDPTADPNKKALLSALKGMQPDASETTESRRDDYVKSFLPVSKRQQMSISEQRKSLPIYSFRTELMKAIRENKILIVIGETGSGKTTQIMQYLYEEGYTRGNKKLGCTQPRRVAAISVAKRVAEEMRVKLGEEVGYSIRFEDNTSPKTLIKYMTEGMLVREAIADRDISNYNVVVLDEAHERNINMDVLFGLMKQVAQRRDDFRLIVTSATLDAEKFSSYFYNCNIFRIPGRTFPVDVLYTKEPESDYLEAALITVMQIHLTEPPGDILLFLTGQEEIDTSCQIINERMKKLGDEAPELIVLPVYSALPSELQVKIFEPAPPGARKCVIATNIAEASLTIDGIYYVIDPGFAKVKAYDSKLGMDTLRVAPISQASGNQRAGRAGRTGPGKCFRLYTEQAFKNEMLPVSIPEIQRTNLANTVLILKAMGINDLINFDFMDPPPVQTLIAALEALYALSALDDEGLLTRLGRKMAEFPIEPQLSKMLLTAVDLGCVEEMTTIIAMLSVQNVFYRPKDKQQQADEKRTHFFHPDGDHITMLTVFQNWEGNSFSPGWCHENFIQLRSMRRAQDVKKQLRTILDRYKFEVTSCNNDFTRIRKAITAGFFAHAARKDPQEGYKTLIDGHQVYIHPSSAAFNKGPECVIYHELVLTSKEYMREVCSIEPKWLVEVAPNFFKFGDPNTVSKRKREEKLEPLQSKYEDPNAWRLSRRKG